MANMPPSRDDHHRPADLHPCRRERLMRPVETIPGKPAGALGAALVELRAVSVEFADGTVGLSRADLSVGAGEFLVLSGDSGAGKSTCLAVLAARLDATSGAVLLAGVDVAQMVRTERVQWRRTTAFAAQDSPLLERRRDR
jgi:ABC-type phosphate/phosphonate transport system ATPase subunit